MEDEEETEIPEPEAQPVSKPKTQNRKPETVNPKPETATEPGPAGLLEEMKAEGITGAIVRMDGIVVHSTFAITDTAAGQLASVSNLADALIKRVGDSPSETEIAFDNLILLIIPIKEYLFCGAIKSRDQKQAVRQYAIKARELL